MMTIEQARQLARDTERNHLNEVEMIISEVIQSGSDSVYLRSHLSTPHVEHVLKRAGFSVDSHNGGPSTTVGDSFRVYGWVDNG